MSITLTIFTLISILLISIPTKLQPIQSSIGFSILGYIIVDYLIPKVKDSFIKRGLFGKDMSKIGRPIIPETIGIIPAITYLFLMLFFIPFLFQKEIIDSNLNLNSVFSHSKLSSYLSSLLSLESMILLGLMDDLFDIRWRHKFFLPAIASIPLLIIYNFEFNQTSILIPKFISNFFKFGKNSINLGMFYYFYMASVSIFCPNSINILAGINGLEVGQTIIIVILLLINDFYYIIGYYIENNVLAKSAFEIHQFSVCFLIPFLGISLSLFKFNKFPSKVFVGDTWCYFSGMVFAVIGISGHFAKTLMLFFLPQILNFIYSSPQLFGLIPCPRHRLPKFNEDDGLLYNSFTLYFDSENPNLNSNEIKELNKNLIPIFNFFEKIYLIKLIRNKKGEIIMSSNLTLINLTIIWFGPCNEGELCNLIMKLQFIIGFIMLILRHTLAPFIFGFDNSWSMLNRFYL
ncbi:tunicamycin resistance protein [Pichia californica]|uniref:UDP-N-acetylglucosamine--dolichyl-phosphate N-acetylglucosaminephosphotransferase n=1 Tax=Pichia californica TaxID=460514 RepID=A0A9P6WNB7_9ASCO|nr:tunicamycin resistance protein [[Candida] californica]